MDNFLHCNTGARAALRRRENNLFRTARRKQVPKQNWPLKKPLDTQQNPSSGLSN